jgi:Fic-DOC domain mobile mystery protein B
MGLELQYLTGQTPLDEDEKEALLVKTISTQQELDEFEQNNIEQAIQWMLSRSFKTADVLTESFVRNLHKRMYGEVWAWAGEFRKTNKNIGADKWEIATALKSLLDDAKHWIDNSIYTPDETAVRFKHRLVSIHCFSNGNGRHSRLMGDLIVNKILNQPLFSWGAADLRPRSEARKRYLEAVKMADRGQMDLLLKFARS